METAIYIVSVKNVEGEWLAYKEVYYYSSLIRTLQERLGNAQIIVSPICECLQFAGLFATSSNPQLNILNELYPIEAPKFLLGLPSSLQHTRLSPFIIGGFSSLYDFPFLIHYLETTSNNSILFLTESISPYFQHLVELRKKTSKIEIFRVKYSDPTTCRIEQCIYKTNKWVIKVRNFSENSLKNAKVLITETKKEIAFINEIRSDCEVKIQILSKKLSPGYKSFEKSLGEYSLIVNYSSEDYEIYGKHIEVFCQERRISDCFYVPEFEIDVGVIDDKWVCRVKNCSYGVFKDIEVWAGEQVALIDFSQVAQNECVLLKFELDSAQDFYVKYKGRIVSSIFHYFQDTIDL